MWGKIEVINWDKTPSISGRVAIEDEIKNGIAVFMIPEGSIPCDTDLPICAIHTDEETGERTPVIIIQAEQINNSITLGVRYLDGGNGVCTLDEVELLEIPNDEFEL